MARWIGLAIVVTFAVSARAQDPATRASVHGTVFDSVAMRPLAGAMVQVVDAGDPSGRIYNAVSDSSGRYSVTDVVAGRYLIGFHHTVLDSLGLESPIRVVVLRERETSAIDLAIASQTTIVSAVCGSSGAVDSTGMIIGRMLDARQSTPLAGATAEVSWSEIIIDARGMFQGVRKATARTNANGWFAVCNVPANVEVALSGSQGADSTGLVAVTVPLAGLTRYDLQVGGTSMVRGTVVDERWRPIRNARVTVVGRHRVAITDSLGAFLFAELPSGSQTLETRALGHAPDLHMIVLRPNADSAFTIRLTTMKRVLDTIRVTAQRLFDRDSRGFLQRKRMGNGQFFDEEYIRRRRPFDMLQLLQASPSVRVNQSGFQRAVYMRGTIGMCKPTLFLDGMRMGADDAGDIDLFARPEEVAGVEVYRAGQVPAQFHEFSGCGVIVVWTKPRIRR